MMLAGLGPGLRRDDGLRHPFITACMLDFDSIKAVISPGDRTHAVAGQVCGAAMAPR